MRFVNTKTEAYFRLESVPSYCFGTVTECCFCFEFKCDMTDSKTSFATLDDISYRILCSTDVGMLYDWVFMELPSTLMYSGTCCVEV